MVSPGVRLLRPLGDGGMASVWVAQHMNLGVQVAVKLLNESMRTLPVVYERFLAEGPAAARIKSAHVVKVFDRGLTDAGVPFIVMELLDGETVQERLDRQGYFSLTETCTILAQTARALSKAHAAGLVHCDVKPDNLFLCDGESDVFVKLLDFGIARRIGERDDSGLIFGTPQYMAPEQLVAGRAIGVFTDIWSLAVVAYQMLTARVPFDATTLEEARRVVELGEFAPVSSLRPDLPEEIDVWFARAFLRDPALRFENTADMMMALEQAMQMPELVLSRRRSATLTELVTTMSPVTGSTPLRSSTLGSPMDLTPFPHYVAPHPPRKLRWVLPVVAGLSLLAVGTGMTMARASLYGGSGRTDMMGASTASPNAQRSDAMERAAAPDVTPAASSASSLPIPPTSSSNRSSTPTETAVATAVAPPTTAPARDGSRYRPAKVVARQQSTSAPVEVAPIEPEPTPIPTFPSPEEPPVDVDGNSSSGEAPLEPSPDVEPPPSGSAPSSTPQVLEAPDAAPIFVPDSL